MGTAKGREVRVDRRRVGKEMRLGGMMCNYSYKGPAAGARRVPEMRTWRRRVARAGARCGTIKDLLCVPRLTCISERQRE